MITYHITLGPDDARHIMAVRARMAEFAQTPNYHDARILVTTGYKTSCDSIAGRLAPVLLAAVQHVCKSRTP